MDSLCALHLMHPIDPEMVQSVAVIGGVSVCLDHSYEVIKALRDQQPITQIIMQSLAGEF